MISYLDIAAWVGATQILTMYALLSLNRIKTRKLYHFFNFTGATFVCVSCVIGKVWQAAAVEGIWAAIALFFFLRACFCLIKPDFSEFSSKLIDDEISHNDVANFAYSLWEKGGGTAYDNWIEAERQLKTQQLDKHYTEDNKALEKYEGRPVQEAFENIKKEFPNYNVILLGDKDTIDFSFDYHRITLVNHNGVARSIVVG